MRKQEEIKEEIKKLQIELKASMENDVPKPQLVIDWGALAIMCGEHINDVKNGSVHHDDKHYIFETLLETVYGSNIWEWYNKQTD